MEFEPFQDRRVPFQQMPVPNKTKQRWSVLAVALFTLSAAAQTSTPPNAADTQQQNAVIIDAVQGGWSISGTKVHEEQQRSAVDVNTIPQATPKEQLDQIRGARNLSLVQNQGTIPRTDKADLVNKAALLNSAAPQSFEAHMANFYAQFPAPMAFQELDLALAKDRDREELIAPELANAARKDNALELTKWAREMKSRGRVAPGLYAYAEDVMTSLEPGAVLIAAGEMDAYPLWVHQFASAKRNDVFVIDQRLLVDPAYRARIWERTKAKGTVPTENEMITELVKSTTRPVYLSLAMGSAAMGGQGNNLYLTGLAVRWSKEPTNNLRLLEERWGQFKKAMDAGPLSQNYLVPGAILLKHYRSIGDETKASLLEHDLRIMAKKLGATERLIKANILAH